MRHKLVLTLAAVLVAALSAFPVGGQKKASAPDLSALAEGKGWQVHGRKVAALDEGGRKGVRFEESSGEGVAWLEGVEFTDGVIEFDVRGRNVLQKSFVGVAFHGADERTYEAVYFRPFNFKSEDAARRSHAVQYISHPAHTWQKLRNEQPGKFEQPLLSPLDPDGWFRARVVVAGPKVSVFVNGAKEPSLTVTRLTDRRSGYVGFWVGNGSNGDFANLTITPVN
jgi:hypothetical protein